MNLQSRLVLFSFFLVTVPLVVTGLLNYWLSSNALEAMAEARLRDTAQFKLAQIVDILSILPDGTEETVLAELIADEIKSIHVGETGFAFLMNQKRSVLVGPEAFRGDQIQNLDFAIEITNKKNGVMEFSFDQKDWVAAFLHHEPHQWYLVLAMEFDEVVDPIANLFWIVVGMIVLFLFLVLIVSSFFIRSITSPLHQAIRAAYLLSEGDLNVELNPSTHDETGKLLKAMQRMVSTFQEVTNVAERVAKGDYHQTLRVKSPKDRLGQALNGMLSNLQSMTETNEQQNWFRRGQGELNEKLRGDQELDLLMQKTINFLSKYLNAQIGVVFVVTDEERLKLISSYAYQKRRHNYNEIAFGEGLVGQAALEKQTIVFANVPDDHIPFKIVSGTGESNPSHIVVVPLIHSEELMGVLELGTIRELDSNEIDWLEQVSESIAISISSAQARHGQRVLLEETRRQSEELKAQQSALQDVNEELEKQTHALKASEEELQAQQEELQAANQELEGKTRTLEIQQEEIVKQNQELEGIRQELEDKADALELSSRYKSEFLANMSHELRTPLNSLLLLAESLSQNKDDNLTEKQVKFATTIHSSGTELLNLINDILDLSKVESGKLQMNFSEYRLTDLSAYVQSHFQHVAEDKGLTLNVELMEGLPDQIFSDQQRVEQIIKNFISNAIKFTREGSVTFRAFAPPPDTRFPDTELVPQKTIALSVIDTGIGIPQDKQKLIFEAFQQADGSTSRTFGGTGLGLSISRELSKALGGLIKLKSESGQGSTFTLYLPFQPPEGSEDASPVAPGNSLETAPSVAPAQPVLPVEKPVVDDRERLTRQDRSLLIVEDDTRFAQIVLDLARDHGFKGLVAHSGDTGLQLAQHHHPDAIILDVNLPEMDGWSVMDALQASPQTRAIPVHFISVLDEDQKAIRMGAIGFLTKPVHQEQLESALQKIESTLANKIHHVLLIENNDNLRDSLVSMIAGKQVEPVAVASGEEAYQLLQSRDFDCIVLDLGLPGMSGLELLEKLEAESEVRSPPVVVYTGQDLTQEEEARLRHYAESIIIKGSKSTERLLQEIQLFLHRVETDLPKEQERMFRKTYEDNPTLDGKTILVVDDDVRNSFALSHRLEEKGMRIVQAFDGKKALERLHEDGAIDLVLMDIMMPEMDGYETMQAIRQLPNFKSMPIIALTAKAMKEDREKCLQAGANDYLPKPVDFQKLFSLIRVWLSQ